MMNGLWVRTEYNSDQILARATTRLKWIGVQHAPFQGVCYGRHAKGHGMYYSGERARVHATGAGGVPWCPDDEGHVNPDLEVDHLGPRGI